MKAVIVDIDGTLADCSHRLHHVLPGGKRDWDAFFASMDEDGVITPVRDVVRALSRDYAILLCSGRPDNYRDVTERWLDDAYVPYNVLYMRPAGDTRADHIVKAQILDGIKEDGYEPFLVIDDRQSVVDMWRDNGLVCLQAAPTETNTYPTTARLTLMVGPSGAGKTSWIRSMRALQHGIEVSHVVSSDQIRSDLLGDFRDQSANARVFEVLHKLVKSRLRLGLPTVVDSTNIRNKDRTSLATMCNVPVSYIVINRPMEDKRRDGGWRNHVDGGSYDLIGKHERTFQLNLKDIMRGDGLSNVTVHDFRKYAPDVAYELKAAA